MGGGLKDDWKVSPSRALAGEMTTREIKYTCEMDKKTHGEKFLGLEQHCTRQAERQTDGQWRLTGGAVKRGAFYTMSWSEKKTGAGS